MDATGLSKRQDVFNVYVFFSFDSIVLVAVSNSCTENNGGCSDICSRTTDGRVCSCHPGFSLDFDGVTCIGTEFASSFFRHLVLLHVNLKLM